jgi:PAS domain S-box-containing protein
VDRNGNIITWNRGARTIFGYENEEVFGKSIEMLMPREYRDRHNAGIKRVSAGGEPRVLNQTLEYKGIHKGGQTFPLELAISGWTVGNEQFFTGIVRDITERKKNEEALHTAKEQAETATKAKSKFLANMSHDLRTPLNAIMGFSDMMRTKTFGPLGNARYDTYANYIYCSGEQLVSLINDILDLSKVEAGKYDLVEETLDISTLIQSSFNQVQNMAEKSGLNLFTAVAPDLPHLRGDKRVMTQVLNNLLSNAIKFNEEGGKIDISAHMDESNCVVISVADTGIGMSRKDINKAMLPFEQADTKHSRNHEGTGLGLSLCVNFMKLHNGDITVQSEVGKGTTVTLRFPPERTIKQG